MKTNDIFLMYVYMCLSRLITLHYKLSVYYLLEVNLSISGLELIQLCKFRKDIQNSFLPNITEMRYFFVWDWWTFFIVLIDVVFLFFFFLFFFFSKKITRNFNVYKWIIYSKRIKFYLYLVQYVKVKSFFFISNNKYTPNNSHANVFQASALKI